MCQGKNRYPSPKVAKQNLKAVQSYRRNRKKKMRLYFCKQCHGWHMTSTRYTIAGAEN